MMLERNELPTLQTFEESLYDISINSIDGEENVLSKYKGKVTMITNVTGECANSAQYPIIESLYHEYRDQGFAASLPTENLQKQVQQQKT